MANRIDKRLLQFPSTSLINIQHLLSECPTLEHQFIRLREILQLNQNDIEKRAKLIQLLIDRISLETNLKIRGTVFGSSVNGLGFKDSDIDLMLKLTKNDDSPIEDNKMSLKAMRKKVPRFLPAACHFINSKRCPILKIECRKLERDADIANHYNYAKIDVSIEGYSPLAKHNSKCIRFLCQLEPKFHLLAMTLRYWSTSQDLIIPGSMSSYALINMLILFCQTLQNPLLPSFDKMRDLSEERKFLHNGWDCTICMDRSLYKESGCKLSLGFLLFGFFEMYLNFNYASYLVNTRPGKMMTKIDFKSSPYYSSDFRLNDFLNIQDPFDLKHNLTGGMSKAYFKRFLHVLKISYETLYNQILTNSLGQRCDPLNNWGLIAVFMKFTIKEKLEGVKSRKRKHARKNKAPPDNK